MPKLNRNSYIFEDTPEKALLKLALPMLVGMLSMTIFNLVDTWYVARLGTLELAAISFTFPVVNLINGLTLGLGVGLTSVVSHKVGSGNSEGVKCYTRDGLILGFATILIFMTIGLLTMKPLFRSLGADDTTLPLIIDYMTIWYYGTAAVVVPMLGNSAIRGTGDSITPAWIMSSAAVANVILDPLMIYGIGPFPEMGLKGAALATVISRVGTMVASLYILSVRDKILEFKIPRLKMLLKRWGSILEVGALAALIHILIPLAFGVLTRLIAGFGTESIAAFGAGSRIEMFVAMLPMSLASGMMVYVGQHWGAKKYLRLTAGINKSIQFSLVSVAVIYVLILIFASPLAGLFTDLPEVKNPLIFYLQVCMAGFIIESVSNIIGATFNGIRRPKTAFSIFILRFVFFMLPLSWAGSVLGGMKGLLIGFALAKVIAGLVSFIFINKLKNELLLKTKSGSEK